jgi:hypothetical protein
MVVDALSRRNDDNEEEIKLSVIYILPYFGVAGGVKIARVTLHMTS